MLEGELVAARQEVEALTARTTQATATALQTTQASQVLAAQQEEALARERSKPETASTATAIKTEGELENILGGSSGLYSKSSLAHRLLYRAEMLLKRGDISNARGVLKQAHAAGNMYAAYLLARTVRSGCARGGESSRNTGRPRQSSGSLQGRVRRRYRCCKGRI